jgi:methionyl-tRNA formyltransferase
MRIVFMGTPTFAVPSLKILLDNNQSVVAVVTVPDKPQGRGQKIIPSPIKSFALQHNLTILQPESLNDHRFISQIEGFEPDLLVVVAFRILPKEVFTIPKHGAINLHASLLPKYRGAAPIQWAIINGEKETGVTTFFLQETVDTGNIILQARVPIGPDETYGELHDRLADVGAEIVLHTVRLIELGKATPHPQSEAEATPAPKISKEQCRIDWKKSAQQIHNLVRGLSPSPCAFTMHGDKSLKVYRTKIVEHTSLESAGTVCEANKRLVVATGSGCLELVDVQIEGKRRMTAEEFLRGYRLRKGDRLT